MRRRSKYLLLLLWSVGSLNAAASETEILTSDAFLQIVRSYHPFIRQAQLRYDRAGADVQQTRGAFDPTVSATVQRKDLENKLYYSYFNPEVTIPTWYGLDLKVGMNDIAGERLNPEATLGEVGYAGLKLSLNELVFDKRLAAVQQARLARTMSRHEQRLVVNDILYDALSTYWMWARDFALVDMLSNQVTAVRQRIRMVRIEVEQGSRAAIDTAEITAQYQALMQQQRMAQLQLLQSGLQLSSFLWTEDGSPAALPGNVVPRVDALATLPAELPGMDSLASVLTTHPKLLMLESKIGILQVEQRLKQQSLLPKVSVNAALLSKDINVLQGASLQPSENYKASVDFNLPLLLRSARGAVRSARLKVGETRWEQSYTQLQLENKLRSVYAECTSLQQQIRDYNVAYTAYQALYRGELTRVNTGESTLFMLNTRELKMLEAAQKLIDLRSKLQKSYAAVFHAVGLLQ